MTKAVLKNKIQESLDEMDAKQLEVTYLLIKELRSQRKSSIQIDPVAVNKQIVRGIVQLDKGEGTDFRNFLNDMQASYGQKP